MAKFLFIDGGGVFGIGPSMALSNVRGLDKLCGIGGTSIGSVLAAQVATGQVPNPSSFDEWMSKVFKHRRFGSPLFWTKYSDKNLNKALRSLFPGKMICDTQIPYFCTAVDMASRSLKVFSSKSDDDANWALWEAVRASCSPPTYIPNWRGMADGGLFANNAAMVGCAWAKMALGYRFEEMEVFSIGCGRIPSSMGQPSDALFSVAPWIIQACLRGASNSMHDYFARSLPLRSYQRVDFTLEPYWKMDSIASMREARLKLADQAKSVSDELGKFLLSI
jgi:hypothetical protein